MRVEHVCQFVSRRVAFAAAIVETPTARQRQDLGVALAKLTGARTFVIWLVEPHRLFLGVEGKRRGRRCGTSGARTLPLLHGIEDNAAARTNRAMHPPGSRMHAPDERLGPCVPVGE